MCGPVVASNPPRRPDVEHDGSEFADSAAELPGLYTTRARAYL